MEVDETRHTGVWLLNHIPSWLGRKDGARGPNTQTATVFDPVALAFDATSRFTNVGWIGLDVMPSSFLYKVMDTKDAGGDVAAVIETWVTENKEKIATEFESRLSTYKFDDLARQALKEAIISYRAGSYLSVVRTLMPEFERFGRLVLQSEGKTGKQKDAVKAIQDYISNLPVGFYPPVESLGAFSMLTESLFATCFTEADATALTNPNRHAELHGLATYGDLRGATKVLSAADFLVSAVNSAIKNAATDP